ncbi:MAG: hypothetical protein C4576_08520 [Desulfobacteraceae bacterium]|nr:MAG: hypothetical protein C4576_08520 [Desulfobacteraceae bacterium]
MREEKDKTEILLILLSFQSYSGGSLDTEGRWSRQLGFFKTKMALPVPWKLRIRRVHFCALE